MKLIKQTRLVFVEGRSDKVYEVDLCEVGANQYVVNFRYGKRGTTLKDGSKTVAPVKRDEADRVFTKLVQSKIDGGYHEEGAAPPARPAAPPPAAPSVAGPAGTDARAQRILDRLAATGAARRWFRAGGGESTWPLERAIWRAGELRLRAAEPLLIALIGTATAGDVDGGGQGMRDYCVAWALGRCGGEAATRALTALYGGPRTPDHVRRIAAESLMLLGDPASTQEFKDHVASQLPAPLRDAAATGDPAAFARALDDFALDQQPDVLYRLYQIDSPTVRPALLDALGKAPLPTPMFATLRQIWKAAELRGDGRALGVLVHRVETTPANRERPQRGRLVPYGEATRAYLRRRSWRLLRRLGQVGDADYVKLAAGVLLAFRDADAVPVRSSTDGRGRPFHYDAFAPYLAFNHILRGRSPRYELRRNGRAWRMKPLHRPDGAAPQTRDEAFPGLWDRNPAALMHLCAESACAPVHHFAGTALLANPTFLAQLDVDDAILLLGRPYDATGHVGFVVARRLYDRANPDLRLLAALATSAHEPGRVLGRAWIDEHQALALADSALLAALVVAPTTDTRDYARQLLRAAALTPAVGRVLIARLVAALLALRDGDQAIARDAVKTILAALSPHLATAGVSVIRDLLAHPLAAVQELGAELLLRHDSRTGLIPADVLLAVLHSTNASVRVIGLRLIAELPEAVLAAMDELLVRMATDGNADLRNGARRLIAQVAAGHPDARARIVAGLIDALVRRKLADEVPSHVLRLLKEDLVAGHATIDRATVLRLLASGSPHAQELGGLLLATRVAPGDLTLPQIIELASHEILSVRQAAWSMYEHDVPRIQANLAAAVRIVDARWLDSRQWAFAFFRRPVFTPAHFTADVLVGVIDSVRDDVQAFGRELLARHFDDADGPTLLLRLAEHPTRAVQLFATNYLERFAAGRPDRFAALVPYFTSVLSRVNQGRIAKQRVLAFLAAEGGRDDAAAATVLPLLFRIAATISIEYRAAALEAMMAIHRARPDVPLPVKVKSVPVLPAGGR